MAFAIHEIHPIRTSSNSKSNLEQALSEAISFRTFVLNKLVCLNIQITV